jgi:hypothetical protein
MIDWLIATAVIMVASILLGIPFWMVTFIIAIFSIAWYLIGDD